MAVGSQDAPRSLSCGEALVSLGMPLAMTEPESAAVLMLMRGRVLWPLTDLVSAGRTSLDLTGEGSFRRWPSEVFMEWELAAISHHVHAPALSLQGAWQVSRSRVYLSCLFCMVRMVLGGSRSR